jgi:glycosyltransferase involved in cell wall biosynthesis
MRRRAGSCRIVLITLWSHGARPISDDEQLCSARRTRIGEPLRILILHSRYLSGSISGENRVVEDEASVLTDGGHSVCVFQPAVDMKRSRLALATDVVRSGSSISEVRRLVAEHRPEVVHVHSVVPRLSPWVLRVLPSPTPLVMTLHNFRLMCLPATFVRDDAICEDCAGRVPWRGVVRRCYRNSGGASAALATSVTVHRGLGTFNRVDLFLAVSRFVAEKHRAAGLDGARVRVKSNFAWPTPRRGESGQYVLYAGRLSREKGVDLLLRSTPPGLRLVVAGDGPERAALRSLAGPSVEFVGEVPAGDMPPLLRNASALVVPSRCYESQGRIVLEAFAAGVPVVASRIGGLPEVVENGVNGLLVEPNDADAWRAALSRIADKAVSDKLGSGAFETWERRFTPSHGLRELESSYELACRLRSAAT